MFFKELIKMDGVYFDWVYKEDDTLEISMKSFDGEEEIIMRFKGYDQVLDDNGKYILPYVIKRDDCGIKVYKLYKNEREWIEIGELYDDDLNKFLGYSFVYYKVLGEIKSWKKLVYDYSRILENFGCYNKKELKEIQEGGEEE